MSGGLFACYGVDQFLHLIYIDHIDDQPPIIAETAYFGERKQVLNIYNGIIVLKTLGAKENTWVRKNISFLVGRKFEEYENIAVTATANLASISNDEHAVNSGYGVDSIFAYRDMQTGLIRVNMNVALRDIDGHLNRISYKVIVHTS